jgi:hypothetical protein
MAAKNQNHQLQGNKTRKRKQVPGAKTEAPGRSATSKKPKLLAAPKPSYPPAKGSTKPFKSPKMKFDKSEAEKEKKPMSKRERRINAKVDYCHHFHSHSLCVRIT